MQGVRAFFAAIWRTVCAAGRFLKRVLKWTAMTAAIGALAVYFPTVYTTTTGWLPEPTQDKIPPPEAVTETHAEWIPPHVQSQTSTYVCNGWRAAQSGAYAAWSTVVVEGRNLFEEDSEGANPTSE